MTSIDCLKPKDYFDITFIKVSNLLLCKIFAKYGTHSGFPRLCVGLWFCGSVCGGVSCVCNNFLLYSITKTILPGSSPHLVRTLTFLTTIPLFLLILGSFRKTRKQDGRYAYFSIQFFLIDFLLETSHIPTVKLLLPFNQCTLTTYFLWKEDRIT